MERELKSKYLVSGTVIEIKFFKKRNFIEHRNTDKGGKLKKKKNIFKTWRTPSKPNPSKSNFWETWRMEFQFK